jgi:hypothetical protein
LKNDKCPLPLLVLTTKSRAEGAVWVGKVVERVRCVRTAELRRVKLTTPVDRLLGLVQVDASKKAVLECWLECSRAPHEIDTYDQLGAIGADGRRAPTTGLKPEKVIYDSPGPARSFLPSFYNRAMNARLVLYWPKRGPMRPALLCRDEEAAALVVLMFQKIRRCPGCGAPLVLKGRSDQEFCNVVCKQRRWRRTPAGKRQNKKRLGL